MVSYGREPEYVSAAHGLPGRYRCRRCGRELTLFLPPVAPPFCSRCGEEMQIVAGAAVS